MRRLILVGAIAATVLAACSTTPTGRRVFSLVSGSQMASMGASAYQEIKQQEKISSDSGDNQYAQCIARNIIAVLPAEQRNQDWEVTVFASDQANAFALPGGKIGVYDGLYKVAVNQSQVAAVMGHEVAHVIAEHSAARMSTGVVTQFGMQVVGAFVGGSSMSPAAQQGIMQAMGLGAQFGVVLPFSRGDESEADIIGLDYMAAAGFDPRESVSLWENMAKAGGQAPPEFASTHPSHSTRINDLSARMDKAMARYNKARAAGRKPNCRR